MTRGDGKATAGEGSAVSPSAARAELRALIDRSEYIKAFDRARRAVAENPDDLALRHLGVLALARMGATGHARQQFARWRLDQVTDHEDVLALWARLLKDEARAVGGAGRADALLAAAAAYETSWGAAGGYFPAINVASLNCLAGRREAAERWAQTALESAGDGSDYYSLATVAEARVILNEPERARAALEAAAVAPGASLSAKSTTRSQLGELVAHLGLDPDLLTPLRPPLVVHFCGHIATPSGRAGRFPEAEVPRVRDAIAAWFACHDVEHAFGSLAAGADILVAEAALAVGCRLDIIMPFDREEFVEASVRPSGPEWEPRFRHCIDAAERAGGLHFVTEQGWLGDDELFAYASHFALGLASLRARAIGTDLHQLAVWDGRPSRPGDVAGTAFDLALGRRLGMAQHIVPLGEGPHETGGLVSRQPEAKAAAGRRVRRTMVFGDLKGFSRLADSQIPAYTEVVLGTCARVLDRHRDGLRFRNTWGDGLFLVFGDVARAAQCAFDLQEAVSGIDWQSAGLPDDLGLRLGIHYGPVYEREDPVLGGLNVFGLHVSRAARVEPITPEGQVYVTDTTAAALAVDAPDRFRCDYVGRVPLAKGYGEFPMYCLGRLPVEASGPARPV